jgi:hypothetical protein
VLGIVCSQKNENTEWLPRFLRNMAVAAMSPQSGGFGLFGN